jgi:hypothetical protein
MEEILLSSGIESYLHVFEYYFGKFATNDIKPIVWCEFISVIIIGFLVRGYFWQKVEVDKVTDSDDIIKRKVKIYCATHTGYEFIIGFIATFVLINFTGANPHAFVVNAGICPGSGFMIGMLFDRKIIMKLEPSNDLDNNYQPQENYYPPPIPQGQYAPQNTPYNPDDKDPYVKPVPVPSPQAPIPPPPAPIENIPVYQPIVQNPNTIAIQVQPQPQIIPQPITIQPVLATPVVTSHVAQRQAEINRQRQEEEDCLACCQILCICLYCLALLGGGR